jgi:CHAT domain-containing protein
MRIQASFAALALCAIFAAAAPVQAQQTPLSLRDSFPIGSNGLCEAQIMSPEPGAGLFDRRYSIVCRDAAAPIGTLWVVRRSDGENGWQRFAASGADCRPLENLETPGALPSSEALQCTEPDSVIRRNLRIGEANGRVYAASGIAAYDDALRLGLASLAADQIVAGNVEIPLTQASDAQAFARAQAAAISENAVLAEAYRRANAGEYAEAAEFFARSGDALSGQGATEARLNEALVQSNLGNFARAEEIFRQVRGTAQGDAVLQRLLRNYEALDALNRRNPGEALAILDQPLTADFSAYERLANLEIGPELAERLAAEGDRGIGGLSNDLTPLERAQLLDGQADYLRATAMRLEGREADAAAALARARATLTDVRGGGVASILWLRAQVLGELAEIEERSGNLAGAEALHRESIGLLEPVYPGSPALLSARAQLAGLFARAGRDAEAIALYDEIVADSDGRPAPALRTLLAPYFELLLKNQTPSEAAAGMFDASQLLLRPGLAQTQAVLARELSGGSDEASQLFRKTINIQRAIERTRASLALEEASAAEQPPEVAAAIAEKRTLLEGLLVEQAELQQQLAEYPRYRVVSDRRVNLADMQGLLREGEAYVKLVTLENSAYMIYATPGETMAYEVDATPLELERTVDKLRASIAVTENGEIVTFPFDLAAARELYVLLFAPVAERLPGLEHVVFEPDGAMLRLPINLLVTDDASIERYAARQASPDADPYDFRETAWLGREVEVSTAVSPAAFRDIRNAPTSSASMAYAGFGQNVPISESVADPSNVRSALAGGANCTWAPAIWNNPIAADELRTVAGRLSSSGAETAVLTGQEFTDTALLAMPRLDEYRILHFATHGLVTAPEPGCPPRPALLTSFGAGDSDGLLSFAEIFQMDIDANLVILSACDTAGSATVGATQEAGLSGGGEFALDGLVRAFVGAGGRTVLASHWPVPDDYDATQRLIVGLFDERGVETAEALRRSQIDLMNQAETSHPFYWAAFAIVGDGAIAARREAE